MRVIHRVKAKAAIKTRTAGLKKGSSDEVRRTERSENVDGEGKAAAIAGIATRTKMGAWRAASNAANEARSSRTITRPLRREREVASTVSRISQRNKRGR